MFSNHACSRSGKHSKGDHNRKPHQRRGGRRYQANPKYRTVYPADWPAMDLLLDEMEEMRAALDRDGWVVFKERLEQLQITEHGN
jgi:hypothetical protein